MTRGLLYWIIVILWVFVSLAGMFGYGGVHVAQASEFILLVLFILLGWQVYGPPIHG